MRRVQYRKRTSISSATATNIDMMAPNPSQFSRAKPQQKSRQKRNWILSSATGLTLLLSTICISSTSTLVANGYAFHVTLKHQCSSSNRYNDLYHPTYYAATPFSSSIASCRARHHSSRKTFLLSATSPTTATGTGSSSGNHTMISDSSRTNDAFTEIGNGDASSTTASKSLSESSSQLPEWLQKQIEANQVMDVPRPTENGGYSHTSASRAKISAANKGKVPWNKGRGRSEATKAKIAEGVRRKNRERFLKKLALMGVKEEEYEAQQAQEKSQKEAEVLSRKTEKGGYRPTDETKQKISKILKEKWARGEVKPRSRDPSKVRRGFTHTEETRAKISASLRKRWANDEEYRARMMEKTNKNNSNEEVRQRISETLRKKWQDPEFRDSMMAKMSTGKQRTGVTRDVSHREKISQAMKKRWQDEGYRKRATEAMKRKRAELAQTRPPKAKKQRPTPTKQATTPQLRSVLMKQPKSAHPSLSNGNTVEGSHADGPRLAQPMAVPKKVKGARKTKTKTAGGISASATASPTPAKKKRKKRSDASSSSSAASSARKKKKKEVPGSKSRLREERRDLYDLLYGDEDDQHDDHDNSPDSEENYDRGSVLPRSNTSTNAKVASVFLEDEDLDDFDPYGLEDF